MASSATKYVIHAPRAYVDYNRHAGNRRQLLVSDQTANILTNFLAVFLALAAKSLYNIARRILKALNQRGANQAPAPDDDTVDQEERRMQRLEVIDKSHDNETLIVATFRRLLALLHKVVPIRPLGDTTPTHIRMLRPEFWYNMFKIANESSMDFLWYFIVGFGALLLYFGMLILGIMSAYPVVGDSIALSRHPQCGLVVSNDAQNAANFALGHKYYNDIARESLQYAKSCYDLGRGASSAAGGESCSFFYEPSIKYSIIDNDTCPFKIGRGHLCRDGENSSYTLTTGSASSLLDDASKVVADASVLGINSPLRYTFHRSITCSPLRTDGLIHPFLADDNRTISFHYFYGNHTGEWNCTSDLPYCTFESKLFPDMNQPYKMMTTSTRRFAPWPWTPIFEVNEMYGESATLILLSNFGIFYPHESLDPIFPANTTGGDGWYTNTQFHATVLGCMSRTLVCLPDSVPKLCFNLTGLGNLDDSDPEHGPIRAMLYFSLLPDLEAQLSYLLTESLEAQSLLSGTTSSALSPTQWKIETRQMFESLLARTQITARNIARGVPGAEDLPGQHDLMLPAWRGMCTRYKFRATGWRNISVSWFLAEFFAGLLVCVLGIAREDGELWLEEPVRRLAKTTVGKWCLLGQRVLVDDL
ncbi:uncharacterized protein Z520_00188 [Fonsecaea multimorphosa CBS 102226]|uniref:Uncharacterized protein n=1 Tax=Fonsecaea multimorphosa CBS 102226 TaxID=1442371 RepID=A0A0D2J288_9EURO|nr:uncharacterized protein Z520_00188 [Fonsecaea multimorphosa CBS 102226]KIY03497.1 hypothetical protein Z520_00188 [Fonsecaea multimorphosa CBS 102226]